MDSLAADKVAFLWHLASRIVPESAALDHAGRQRFEGIIDEALGDRSEATRRQFAAFLGVLRLAPVFRFGRPLDRLSEDRQDRVLRFFEDCPVSLLRKGFWGLKAMVFMGYYGQREQWSSLGYAPRLRRTTAGE